MNKQDCLNKALAASHAANLATARAAMYAKAFGGNDKLTQDALLEADVAMEAAAKWNKIAEWHPKTRDAAIRNQSLPAFMFGF